jgi:hypothetical protein
VASSRNGFTRSPYGARRMPGPARTRMPAGGPLGLH